MLEQINEMRAYPICNRRSWNRKKSILRSNKFPNSLKKPLFTNIYSFNFSLCFE